MRLHRLTLTAIGPFAAEQVVDFDQLGAGGLFLLDGPTGAGKTTVLDAITFALYGAPANNGDGRLHSDFADPATTPTVCLEFSLRGRRHRVTRTPQHERPKRRGDGVTTVAATAHLDRWEGARWVSRSSNKAEVAEMLADEVGLTREQFTQVVLLPQGEFATFLRASDDDRRALLTKLFGTQLYDRITDELDRRRQSATKDLDSAAQRVLAGVAAAAEAAGLDAADGAELAAASPAERAVRIEELTGTLAARHDAATSVAAAAAEACAATRAACARAEADADRLSRFRRHLSDRDEHERGREAHETALRRLADARRAEPVAALLRAAAESRAATASARDAVAALGADDDHLRGAGADALEAAALSAATAAAELQHLVDQEAGLDRLRHAVAAAQAVRRAALAAIGAVDGRLAAVPGELTEAEARAQRMRGRADGLAAALARHDLLARRLAAARAMDELGPALNDARTMRSAAVDAHQAAVEAHQRLVDRRLAGMAAELAGQLTPGEPCAVCGSPDHPAPARAAADAVSAAALDAAARARAAAEAERSRRETALADLERAAAGHAAVADGADAEVLSAEIAAAVAEVRAAESAAADLDAVEGQVAALRAEAERLRADRVEAAQALTKAEADLEQAGDRLADLSAALDDARADYASVAERQAALRMHADGCGALAVAVRALAAAAEVAADAEGRVQRESAAAGFASVDDAAAAVIDAAHRDRLQAEVDAWSETAQHLAGALGSAEFAGLDPSAADSGPDQVGDALEQARNALAAAQRAETEAGAAAERARHAVERFGLRAGELAEVEAEYERLRADAEPVTYLAKLAKGMTGQRRVALTTYVLRHWFEQVVAAANVRLGSISAGRYELLRVDEGSARNERTGLTLQVVDRHTGEARSPRSLSGGETFYTSLALALGLADVVRAEAGCVDLDTLFIDEGFGTLDADTLDQVMAVIDDLRDRGRVVGIVSHIADLKDRIPERLEVRRLPDGSSSLRIVA